MSQALVIGSISVALAKEEELDQEEHLLALAQYFDEGRAPTPPPDPEDRRGLIRLRNFMADYPEGEAPWVNRWLSAVKGMGKKKPARAKKPYSRPSSSKLRK
ncbi:hypothetical protein RhiJN_24439 [Ceratobasidium sp. AG-Ba]|nr:hypothetical protein RhiJN_24439 [Ceratobasidium sp. AG-Ba]